MMKKETEVVVLEDILKKYEGSIVKVMSRQRCVRVQPPGTDLEHGMWLSYEVAGDQDDDDDDDDDDEEDWPLE